ncbi:UDP-N-acetylenolpyruvoylglucosamine reductase [Candidatus Kaiserbacteria bacterium RIFCSPLOWO2_01_FULL_54_13]|uniref:UDP-N-acetylenolpyruvoylglucosamine reductase n=1 Tax=Candidatus Kaiserbacteria bacterium RIFCSPLOWO2_01_FULL_54_13 TaxID=1798512 RepID=A0A1F6F3K0_9BACT|nr:MAG: UDP-N-acetylenolpyruvoylglucosamine reductase [Candidatus Kaiserbacteria bacterium RIFCSPLOWO2_01_FULL_54_13]
MLTIKEHVQIAPLTTFGIGGPARYFVDVRTEDEIRAALAWARERGLRFVVLAGKSNVLVPDEGLDALVINITSNSFSFSGTQLSADAGCNLLTLVREATKRGLGGWEKLAGIPGTMGGAVRGNAGAFGPEIKDFVISVRALSSQSGEYRDFVNRDIGFAYRDSFFKRDPQWIITRVRVKLAKADPAASVRFTEETIAERERRHIQNVRAAGSFFVNPVVPRAIQELFEREKGAPAREGRVPAGWLIEKVGLKGARVGDAVASGQHPNYLKNDGKASAKDVLALAQKIKDAVRKQFGIELQEEAVVL